MPVSEAVVVAEPAGSFLVNGNEGPLIDSELDRAGLSAQQLISRMPQRGARHV